MIRNIIFALLIYFPGFVFSDDFSIKYHLMNQEEFKEIVVGNTIVGVTRQSHSLYMLYFLPDGYCELWKQNQIYVGSWWIEKDELDREVVRGTWPSYTSSEPHSIFSPENPRYGTATSIKYYIDSEHNSIYLAGRKFKASVVLVPGCAFQ